MYPSICVLLSAAPSYVTNLGEGRIEGPGYEKMRAIAKAMASRRNCGSRKSWALGEVPAEPQGRGVSGRLEHLFEAVRNPARGDPHTSSEVARMSAGDLTQEDVVGIGTGGISEPTLRQVAAL